MKAVLVINRSDSRCGYCGKPAFPDQLVHDDRAGWSGVIRGGGCGVRWTHVGSDYRGGGIEEATQRMRPDLEWIDEYIPPRMGGVS